MKTIYRRLLRDYFAAKAMQAAFAHTLTHGINDGPNVAKAAYEVAERMLYERSKDK